jgi:Uma2 family endonuclease
MLYPLARDQHLGEVLPAPVDVVLSSTDVVQPDLIFLSAERRNLFTEDNVQGAPDLVGEILSEATRRKDEVTKRHLYQRFGVAEYWVIDPELETVKVYRRSGEWLERQVELSLEAKDRLSSPLFPRLEIPLADLFAQA